MQQVAPVRRRLYSKKNLSSKLLIGLIVAVILGFFAVVGIFAFMARDLPSPGNISRNDGSSTVFYDRDGKVLFEMYKDQNRVPVGISQVPDLLKKATIAVEDKNFYSHSGFSTTGILRAVLNTATKGRLEGGSTLTQQLVKIVLLTRERTLTRKMKEFVLATEIERRYTKDQILEMYLNEAPYGGSYWGVQSASQGYFGKDVKDLDLLQSAILAGLPQSPSRYSPYIGEKDLYKTRTKIVLRRMREDKYITAEQEKKALKDLETITFGSPKLSITAPQFVFYVRDQLVKEFGESVVDQGLKITTTLSYDAQKEAEKIVREEVEKIKPLKATNGSLVAIDTKTNEIIAYVGSYDYNEPNYGRFDTVSQALRQPGSSIKPFTYVTAFEKGYTPATLVMDVSTEFPNQGDASYTPVNYDGKFHGPVQLRFALGNSYNIPAVKLLAMVGVKSMLQTASSMGITTLAPTTDNLKRFGLSLTLGGGEVKLIDLANAYATFAREGEYSNLVSIKEVKDHKGKVIYKQKDLQKKQVISKESAFLISHILSDNNARVDAFGTRSFLNIPGKTVAVKTGTTNSKRDNWTLGYTKEVAVGVWIGNNDNSPMNEKIASGVTGASPIWNRMMRYLLKDYKDGMPDKPNDVSALQIDGFLGGLPKDGNPTRSEYFSKGTEPTDISPFYKKIKMSKADPSKLANDLEISKGAYDEKEYIVISEKDPISKDGKNRWQEAIDAWMYAQPDDRFKPPRDQASANADEIAVSIKSPSDKSTVDSNTVELRIKIASVEEIENVEIYINDAKYKDVSGNQKEIIENLQLSDGVYKIGVKARNKKGKTGEAGIQFGVKKPWDGGATPVPTGILPTL